MIIRKERIRKNTKKSIGNIKDRKEKNFGFSWQLVVALHHDFTSCYDNFKVPLTQKTCFSLT